MNRRQFVLGAGVGVAATATASYWWLSQKDTVDIITLQDWIQRLHDMRLQRLQFAGSWNATEVFNHLAQSIEFSMVGYPEHRSDIFQSLVGKPAFALFQQAGAMTHDLAEAIPAAPPIAVGDEASAIKRLITALDIFKAWQGELKPHFAYGALTYQEYAIAHSLHISDHFTELV